jgi:hypothetical protein
MTIQFIHSLFRLEEFLLYDQLEKMKPVSSAHAISLNGDFSWDIFGKTTLPSINPLN